MSKGPEARFKTAINKLLPAEVYRQSMYTPYSGGTPDMYYEGPKGCLWVEYKFLTSLPATIDVKKILSPLQNKWLQRANKNGIRCVVLIGYKKGGTWLYCDQAITKQVFFNLHETKKEIARFITEEVI